MKSLQFFRRKSSSKVSTYGIGNYKIEIPQGHTLPSFQAANRLYDRFVSVLGEALPDKVLIVDVGANIGDSAAALCCVGRKKLICIEPAPAFYSLLKRNVEVLRSRGHEVVCVNKIIGLPNLKGEISETASSGKLVLAETGMEIHSLDEVIMPFIGSSSEPILIKSDTDGCDAEVIASARKMLCQSEPLLFWEAQIDRSSSIDQYCSAFWLLKGAGYDKFSVFDNFGNLMFETGVVDTLIDVCKYLYTMSAGQSTRTLYYVDICASTTKRRNLHDRAIEIFRSRYLRAA